MATYYELQGSATDGQFLDELNIYGSSRIGMLKENKNLVDLPDIDLTTINNTITSDPMQSTHTRGTTYFELSNHLGNVLAVVTDRKLAQPDGSGIAFYLPDMVSATDYYPFGYEMGMRSWNSGNYRYGFNGMEADDEITGSRSHYNTEFWMYDSRIGRRWEIDPKTNEYPHLSPYSVYENNPIYFIDISGEDADVAITRGTVTVSAKIYIYGSGATAAQAQKMQTNIMNDWNNSGKGWTYTDKATGETYNVKFDVAVELYDKSDPTNVPTVILDSWNPASTKNYIEVGASAKDVSRSYVRGGDEGKWRGYGSDPSSHEFGHLIGLDDQYTDAAGSNPGWSGNIMAEPAGVGVVQQKNIDALLTPIIDEYKTSDQYQLVNKDQGALFWNYNSKIDESSPSWETPSQTEEGQ